jgi:hypothetical protein
MSDIVTFRGQSYERTEDAIVRVIKLLRAELEATLEAAERIEELVLKLKERRVRHG